MVFVTVEVVFAESFYARIFTSRLGKDIIQKLSRVVSPTWPSIGILLRCISPKNRCLCIAPKTMNGAFPRGKATFCRATIMVSPWPGGWERITMVCSSNLLKEVSQSEYLIVIHESAVIVDWS